ncbi:MAG: hypothetical protein ACFE0R_16675 [Salinarimonas sp.]
MGALPAQDGNTADEDCELAAVFREIDEIIASAPRDVAREPRSLSAEEVDRTCQVFGMLAPANDDEAPTAGRTRHTTATTRPATPAVKKAQRPRRERVADSRANASLSRRAGAPSAVQPGAGPVSNPHHLPTPHATANRETASGQSAREARPEGPITPRLKRWADTAYPRKVQAYGRAMEIFGPALAFTLHVDERLTAKAKADAERFKKDIARDLARVFGRALPDRSPHFVFVVGVSTSGQVHLHGAVVANDNDRPEILTALRKVGGAWRPKGHAGEARQADARVCYEADGWSYYMERHVAGGRRLLGRDPVYAPNHLRRLARELHEAERSRSEAPLGMGRLSTGNANSWPVPSVPQTTVRARSCA